MPPTLAAAAEAATDSAQREATFKKAQDYYRIVFILAFTKQLQVNLLFVYSYAYEKCLPTEMMDQNLDPFYARMLPVVEAVLTFDLEKMWAAVEGYASGTGIDAIAVRQARQGWREEEWQKATESEQRRRLPG